MITDIKFECSSCGQKMLVDAEAAGMHADCPACGGHITVPKVRAMNDRDYASPKSARKREASRHVAAPMTAVGVRQNGAEGGRFSDPELSELRQELLDASVQTSELERELADARAEAARLKSELQKISADAESRAVAHRKVKDELRRLTDEHQAICLKFTAAASDRDTSIACTQQMADEIEEIRRRAEAAEALMEEAHQQLEVYRAENTELTQAVAAAQEEIAASASRVEEQELEIADARARLLEVQSERTTSLRKIDLLQQHQTAAEIELESLRAKLAEAEKKATRLEAVELQLAEAAQTLNTLETQALRLEKDLSESTAECQSLRRSLSEDTIGKDLMATRDQLAEATTERDRLAGQARQLSDDLKSVLAVKAERDEQVKTLTRELDEARRRAEAASEARLRQDNEVLRGIIARQNTELEQKHTQLVRLKRARFGVRLAYASFALGLVLVAAWALKTVPGLQLSGFLKF